MKASELIAFLQDLINIHGDLDIGNLIDDQVYSFEKGNITVKEGMLLDHENDKPLYENEKKIIFIENYIY